MAQKSARRSADDIERELDETTQHLASDIDELATRLNPKALVRDGVDSVKRRLVSPSGAPRPEVVGAVAGAVIVGVVLWQLRKR